MHQPSMLSLHPGRGSVVFDALRVGGSLTRAARWFIVRAGPATALPGFLGATLSLLILGPSARAEQPPRTALATAGTRGRPIPGPEIGDEEVDAFYLRHRSNPALRPLFTEPERVTASHILIEARASVIRRRIAHENGIGGQALLALVHAEVERARRRAERVRREALAGADFAALARRWSEDPSTRHSGGELGSFTRDTRPGILSRAAFALPTGAVSPVLETEHGFHVVKVTRRDPARLRTLGEARPAIREYLSAGKRLP
jgi:hypothetical protein